MSVSILRVSGAPPGDALALTRPTKSVLSIDIGTIRRPGKRCAAGRIGITADTVPNPRR